MECNLGYSRSKNRDDLDFIIEELYHDYVTRNKNLTKDDIISEFSSYFVLGNTISLTTEEIDNLKEDVITSVRNQNKVNPYLTLKEVDFANLLLSSLIKANPGSEASFLEELETLMANDEERVSLVTDKFEVELANVFGPIGLKIGSEIESQFHKDIIKRVVFDVSTAEVFDLSNHELNERINDYKSELFELLVRYMKLLPMFKDDAKILQAKSMFDKSGVFQDQTYNYVMNKFKDYLLSRSDRYDVIDLELDARISMADKTELLRQYEELLAMCKNHPEINKWFITRYANGTNPGNRYKRALDPERLFEAGKFSKYFIDLKHVIVLLNGRKSVDDKFIKKIDAIENPKSQLLTPAITYFTLAQFDTILKMKSAEGIGVDISKDFKINQIPIYKNELKYLKKQDHKHFSAGWETASNEGAEKHTSANLKVIYQLFPVFNYETGQETGQSLTVSDVQRAWNNLLSDIKFGKLDFRTKTGSQVVKGGVTIQELLKAHVDTLDEDVVGNVRNILKLLFEDGYDGITYINNIALYSKFELPDRNILYSLYELIFNINNDESIISLELGIKRNHVQKISKNFLNVTSDIAGNLFRNVPNTYLDVNLMSNNPVFGKRRTFNWDRDLFAIVEAAVFPLKQAQHSGMLGTILSDYFYDSDYTHSFITLYENDGSAVTLDGKEIKLGYEFPSDSIYKLFSYSSECKLYDKDNVLGRIAKVDLSQFKRKIIQKTLDLEGTDEEKVLYKVLKFIDLNLTLGLLSESGLDTLLIYARSYTKNPKRGLRSDNYLEHFFKLAMQAMEVRLLKQDASVYGNGEIGDFLTAGGPKCKYSTLYDRELNKSGRGKSLFSQENGEVFLVPFSKFDVALNDFALFKMIATGRSSKATSLNKSGDSVSNYSVSRLGSELNRRIHKINSAGNRAGSRLIFAGDNGKFIEVDPVIDAEVTTAIGDVKLVKDMTSAELFHHAILDKFYLSYLKQDKVCILPTVYSDKTTFLNYLIDLNVFGTNKNIMKLTEDFEETFLDKYALTFFGAHATILLDSADKFKKLREFAKLPENSHLSKPTDFDEFTNTIDEYREFLRSRSFEELTDLAIAYNKKHDDKIDIELDKDARKVGSHCEINEILEYYFDIYLDWEEGSKTKLRKFINKQKQEFVLNINDYNLNLVAFDDKSDLDKFVNGEDSEVPSVLLRILQDSKILDKRSRFLFVYGNPRTGVKPWIDANTGKLIISRIENGVTKLNPILEKFFYMEGILSNNLRMMLSGSEINHPDKAKITPFRTIKTNASQYKILRDAIKKYTSGNISEFRDLIEPLIDLEDSNGNPISDDELFNKAKAKFNKISEEISKYVPGQNKNYESLKETADYLFDVNPELSKVGTKDEYIQYLQSIYPDSEIKDVYWHGTSANFARGFNSAERKDGSTAPETKGRNDMYFNKQPYASIQYVPGINVSSKVERSIHWNKLIWVLKEIMGKGQKGNAWMDTVINDATVRDKIPNKKGQFNRTDENIRKDGEHGKFLSEYKKELGYEGASNELFFTEVFGLKFGEESFNQYIERNRIVFQNLFNLKDERGKLVSGLYPVLINSTNPITESGQDTYYEENRGLLTLADKNDNDAIISESAKNEFGSDVVVVIDGGKSRKDNIHWLGSEQDIDGFKLWMNDKSSNDFENLSVALLVYDLDNASSIHSFDKVKYSQLYEDTMINIINTALGTLFKRNVIIPATLQHLNNGLINGVSTEMIVAVIEDLKAPVNNLRESDSIDAQDGSALISSIALRLENNSLGDQRVGTNRKPIIDDQTDDLTSFLAKFAAFGQTGAIMRQSILSNSPLYLMFKKMHHLRWNGEIDLTHKIEDVESVKNTNVGKWFKQKILQNKHLYYKNLFDQVVEIKSFGIDNVNGLNVYYTIESAGVGEDRKVYHYFDNDGNHYTEQSSDNSRHTIDSLYELFQAMGGLLTMDLKTGEFNEDALDIITNFVINVGHRKEAGSKIISAKDVYQPLKSKFISYAFNTSAVKNGARNVNKSSAWKDNSELKTFSISTKGVGIQLNADHDLIDAQMTEFSQVIAACAAYGKTFDNAQELYYSLGKAAFEASEKELKTLDNYYKLTDGSEEAKKGLYLIVGKLIVESKSNSNLDLTNRIKNEVKLLMQKHQATDDDALKIPFSDPSLYNLFITSITSTITTASIKRKHPGSGMVMVPAYDVVLTFSLWDDNKKTYNKYMFDDVLYLAKQDLKRRLFTALKVPEEERNNYTFEQLFERAKSELEIREDLLSLYLSIPTSDITLFNKALVNAFLQLKLRNEETRDKSWFMPTDKIRAYDSDGKDITDQVKYINDPNDKTGTKFIDISDLSDMKNYYAFKNHDFGPGITFKLDVTSPMNLKPSLIRWQYEAGLDAAGNPIIKYMNIYDHPVIKRSWKINQNPNLGIKAPARQDIQDVLDNLHKGFVQLGNKNIRISNLENTEAELVMGNIYRDMFGVGNDSLAKVLAEGDTYFERKFEESIPEIPKDGPFHFAFTKLNGKHTYISCGNIDESNPNIYLDDFNTEWCDDTVVMIKNEDGTTNNRQPSYEIYSRFWDVSKKSKSKNVIKIGKYIEDENLKYDKDTKTATLNGEKLNIRDFKVIFNEKGEVSKVLRRIDYVKRYLWISTIKIPGTTNTKTQTHTLYRIMPSSDIKKALDPREGLKSVTDSDVNKQISSIVEHLYNSDKYIDIEYNFNSKINVSGENKSKLVERLKACLWNLGNKYKGVDKKVGEDGTETWEMVEKTPSEISKLTKFQQHIIRLTDLILGLGSLSDFKQEKTRFYKENKYAKKLSASFLNSLHFIVSRIPAQSFQSFMPMKCVGWTGDTNNTAYVSYIQTYLQGSDYDIDKAYVMGQSFSENGEYIEWSPLFDFRSYETLEASKTLPVPKGMQLKEVPGDKYNIDQELEEILGYNSKAKKSHSTKIRLISNLIRKLEARSVQDPTDPEKSRIIYYNFTKPKEGANKKEIALAKAKLKLIEKIQRHEDYELDSNIAVQAYKNIANANIFAIIHDIRNRDLAYSPITMKDLLKIAEESPKGVKTKALNMMNPLTKYIMLNQNLIGKNVIGIAANGEKDWFNITLWTHSVLNEGEGDDFDDFYISMNKNYSRIEGRGSGELVENPKPKLHIPDLWNASPKTKARLIKKYYGVDVTPNTADVYVDQMVSQLLSAATDNAKELILYRINCGTEFAKYYIHLTMLGFNMKDISAFMTSPVVELIDKYGKGNIYTGSSASLTNALNLLEGKFDYEELKLNKEFVPTNPEEMEDYLEAKRDEAEALREAALDEYESMMDMDAEEQASMKSDPDAKKYGWVVSTLGNIYKNVKATSLPDFINKYVHAKLGDKEMFMVPVPNKFKVNPETGQRELEKVLSPIYQMLRDYQLPKSVNNLYTSRFFEKVENLIKDINYQIEVYSSRFPNMNYDYQELLKDVKEFRKLSEEAQETSTLASTWLKLNQGIPGVDNDIIKLLQKMNKSVITRELKMGIKKPRDFSLKKSFNIADEDVNEDGSVDKPNEASTSELYITDLINILNGNSSSLDTNIGKVVKKISENNKNLSLSDICNVLIDSIRAEIYGNFDINKFLRNDMIAIPNVGELEGPLFKYKTRSGKQVSYRELASAYYNLIKSTWNILDIMTKIPHYNENLNLLSYTVSQRENFAVKSRLVDLLIKIGQLGKRSLSDKEYKVISQYADKVIITSFFMSLKDPIKFNGKIIPKVYNLYYDKITRDELNVSTLNGIDSLKTVVEDILLPWLKSLPLYENNPLIKELKVGSNYGKSLVSTLLNLSEIDYSISNRQTFNNYLNGIKELHNEKIFKMGDKDLSIADVLMLYNLAVNGTKLGGKYLTGIFKELIKEGSILYDYYKFLGNMDSNQEDSKLLPTKRDLLIAMSPIIYSEKALVFRTEPYVKVANPETGYDIYYKKYDSDSQSWKYEKINPKTLLPFPFDITKSDSEINKIVYNYTRNSTCFFPELHKQLTQRSLVFDESGVNINELARLLVEKIRNNELLIYKNC